jgi:N-acetyl-gamma-glutamylphosphate reductase
VQNMNIMLGFDEKAAVEEANRCLKCWTLK